MENIQINTTQNVSLSYQVAGVGLRLLSIMLDTVFKYAYLLLVYFIFFYAIYKKSYSGDYEERDNYNQIMIGLVILVSLPALIYHLLCETFLNGQSFGKKIMKIKVVKVDGTQPNFGSYLVRSMFRIIDNGIIGLITIAVSNKTQRLGDMVAGTTVIQLNKQITLRDTILHKQKTDYKIVYSQVALLSDADANIIKEVLEFSYKQNQPEHIKLLANKIKTKYGIYDVKQKDEFFLNTLLVDYSHYQFER
jgi:uncharacterized RDD family membrane protein YckC